ncbi:hypothetical protein [uncultured Methanomethylovorans sp.]|uniref:hypothetical protein n=1 Tax=uncultured Methanomethylovorans sp. TaxID=183759 RepID=UPI002AA7600B|nr:hypothetical protein [uncultured Methanomethylovorans sp.]
MLNFLILGLLVMGLVAISGCADKTVEKTVNETTTAVNETTTTTVNETVVPIVNETTTTTVNETTEVVNKTLNETNT